MENKIYTEADLVAAVQAKKATVGLSTKSARETSHLIRTLVPYILAGAMLDYMEDQDPENIRIIKTLLCAFEHRDGEDLARLRGVGNPQVKEVRDALIGAILDSLQMDPDTMADILLSQNEPYMKALRRAAKKTAAEQKKTA